MSKCIHAYGAYVITLTFMKIYVRRADVCTALPVTINEGSRQNNALKFVDCRET
jgi:hypothetical protein